MMRAAWSDGRAYCARPGCRNAASPARLDTEDPDAVVFGKRWRSVGFVAVEGMSHEVEVFEHRRERRGAGLDRIPGVGTGSE
jgi:hypothetical protein